MSDGPIVFHDNWKFHGHMGQLGILEHTSLEFPKGFTIKPKQNKTQDICAMPHKIVDTRVQLSCYGFSHTV